MLNVWMEILPLFMIRWLAKRYCERLVYSHEGKIERIVVTARPDVLIKLNNE